MKTGISKIRAIRYTPVVINGKWDWTVMDETMTYIGDRGEGDLLLYRRDTDGKVCNIVIKDDWMLLPR
jgi:hypothetical protein